LSQFTTDLFTARNSIIPLKLKREKLKQIIKLTAINLINWLALIKADENVFNQASNFHEMVFSKRGLKNKCKFLSQRLAWK
jgi:hypothetical protein